MDSPNDHVRPLRDFEPTTKMLPDGAELSMIFCKTLPGEAL